MDAERTNIDYFFHTPDAPSTLTGNHIYSIYQDRLTQRREVSLLTRIDVVKKICCETVLTLIAVNTIETLTNHLPGPLGELLCGWPSVEDLTRGLIVLDHSPPKKHLSQSSRSLLLFFPTGPTAITVYHELFSCSFQQTSSFRIIQLGACA